MSKGLGKVEKVILQALAENPHEGNRAYCGGVSVSELACYVENGLDTFSGGDNKTPSLATYQSTARAVRSLERKELIICQHVQRYGLDRCGKSPIGGLSWNKGVKLNKCLDHFTNEVV